MSCGLEKDRLSGYYDGELDAGERAEIERHIASCSECLRELGDLKAAATDLKSLARVPAPPSVRAEILRQTAVRAPRFQRWFQAGVAAAAVALFAVSLVIIARRRGEGCGGRPGGAQAGQGARGQGPGFARRQAR
jgi:anti-sigma factor RsiW